MFSILFFYFLWMGDRAYGDFSFDQLYVGAKPEFVRMAFERFDRWYFSRCPHFKKSLSLKEREWIERQEKHIFELGFPLTEGGEFKLPMYSWKAVEEEVTCHSKIMPRFEKSSKETEVLKAILKSHGIEGLKMESIHAVEFFPEEKRIHVYDDAGEKIRFEDLAKDRGELHKIAPFVERVAHSMVFLSNIYPGFLPSGGDMLAKEIRQEFYFKPRALKPHSHEAFLIYYP